MRPYHRKLRPEPLRILVQHADANRSGPGPTDGKCPRLTHRGRAQAEELALRLSGLPIARVLASPARPCLQTVEPLATDVGVPVEPCALLAAAADLDLVARFLTATETENAVLCTNRELILGVFSQLALSGTRLIDGLALMDMAGAWALHGGGGLPIRVDCLRPLWMAETTTLQSRPRAFSSPGGGQQP